ncbi:MAG: hypothetical protein JSS81_27660 [Acidobacteria bacterium]|nr:hypothetical protein [Acidobacteriota bacterium]
MIFDNYTQNIEKDVESERRSLVFAAVAIVVLIFLVLMCVSYRPTEPEHNDLDIDSDVSTGHRRAAELCRGLPRPENFAEVGMKYSADGRSPAAVDFYFYSDREPQEIFPSFILWFEREGWKNFEQTPDIIGYSKGLRTVTVKSAVFGNANYSIHCTTGSY